MYGHFLAKITGNGVAGGLFPAVLIGGTLNRDIPLFALDRPGRGTA